MKKFLPLFSPLLILLLTRCSPDGTLQVKARTDVPSELVLVGNPETEEGDENKTAVTYNYYWSPRYFSIKGSSGALSKILAMGATEALRGNTVEAEILFLELKGKEKNGSVENNLAILCEINSDNNCAFELYSSAILIDPDNDCFKKNFFYFLSASKKQPKKKLRKNKTDAYR